MNVVVTVEHRFFRTPDGAVWTQGLHAYPFWNHYLSVFEGVKVVARVRDVLRPEPDWCQASGTAVRFLAVPDYLGPWQYLAKSVSIRRAIRESVDPRDAVIMRVSSHIAGCLEPVLFRRGQPYGLQVVSDPFEMYAPGAVDYRLRPLFRWRLTRQLRRQCQRAAAAAYVTEQALQSRYPCAGFTVGFSDVEIPPEALRDTPRAFSRAADPRREFRLVTLASLAQMYKAPDVLIRAVAEGVQAGLNLQLRIAGDGKHRAAMERLTAALGLADRVHFLGQVPAGARVREELDSSDLFLLPSRAEGLPRALVEAMARSLPCIGSTVGGIPELLVSEDLVPPGDTVSLARKLIEVLREPNRMDAMAARNLLRATDFRDDLLEARRRAFFHEVRRVTARWIGASASGQRLKPAETEGY
ncbi:MAG: glycosyltransferase family 4 protein [Bryobacteraceae bacterium]